MTYRIATAPLAVTVLIAGALGGPAPARATDQVLGTETTFTSYYGTPERCVRIAPMPGAAYDEDDLEDEADLCSYDLYDDNIALCPKIWSTSPSIVLYDLEGSVLEGERLEFQTEVCAGGKVAEYVASDELARLKFTMNQETTSAAYAPAPILYYHFARYLGTEIKVPVAVWRTVDSQVLLVEVAEGGAALTAGTDHLNYIHAAWSTIAEAIRDPASWEQPGAYGTAADLLAADGNVAYGTLLDATDKGHGPEVNGLEPDPWSEEARFALFQQTPGFIALTTEGPLEGALDAGIAGAVPPVAETMPDGISREQVAFWAQELSEIVLLDYILAQQDRPGNIDRKPYYYWLEDGEAERKKAKGRAPGDGEIPEDAVMIVRSVINDNDAAGRVEYDNHTKLTGMLTRLRHFDGGMYTRLQALAEDMAAQGPAYEWLHASLGLEAGHADMIAANAIEAAGILAGLCESGQLRFDLDAKRYFETGQAVPEDTACRPE